MILDLPVLVGVAAMGADDLEAELRPLDLEALAQDVVVEDLEGSVALAPRVLFVPCLEPLERAGIPRLHPERAVERREMVAPMMRALRRTRGLPLSIGEEHG